MRPAFPRLFRTCFSASLLLAVTAGEARASSDPDVNEAQAIVAKLDRLTKDEFARYTASLDKYADEKQKLFASFGTLLEADEAEVNGKWDQICDNGLARLAELVKAVPADATSLDAFYKKEAAVWEILKKIPLPEAEEAETRVRKMLELITPAMTKAVQESIDEDKRGDERSAKLWSTLEETGASLTRILIAFAIKSPDLKKWFDDRLKDAQARRAVALAVKQELSAKAAQLKAFSQRVLAAGEVQKQLMAGDDDAQQRKEAALAALPELQQSRAAIAHAERWVKIVNGHYGRTRDAMTKYDEVVNGRLVGKFSDETKAQLGDLAEFKERFAQMEADDKAIEEGLVELGKQIEELRDGDYKSQLKDILKQCRDSAREVADIRKAIKSEYESALGDAGLK